MSFDPSSSHGGISDPIDLVAALDEASLSHDGLNVDSVNGFIALGDTVAAVFTTQVAGGIGEVILGPHVTSAPPDLDLQSSQVALWLDATPGATKLMVKAKDSGGTVRTAAIALA